MRSTTRRATSYPRPLREILQSPWILLPPAVIAGAFLAYQVFRPTPRYVKLIFGLLVLAAILLVPLHAAMTFFVVVFPAPTFIFIGDTNVIFLVILTVVWIVQRALGKVPKPVRTPIDFAILWYLAAHLLSFFNVDTAYALGEGMRNFVFLAAGTLMYFLLTNAIRTEKHLENLLKALCVTALFVDVTALYEYFTDGGILIPDWFIYRAGQSAPSGERVGGIFGSHALLADFSAILFYVQVYLAMRTKRIVNRIYYVALAILGIVMIALSVNRGGAVIWLLGGALFLVHFRKRLRWSRVVMALAGFVVLLFTIQLLTGRGVGDIGLIARIMGSQFVRGIPETRVIAWTNIFARIEEHPLIGHGPFYDLAGGARFGTLWPHSGYLWYLYTTGIVGLAAWLWIMGKLIWKSAAGWRSRTQTWSLGRTTLVLAHIQIIMFAAAQIRSDHQRGNVYLYFMWILFALAAISHRLYRQEPVVEGGEETRSAPPASPPAPRKPPRPTLAPRARVARPDLRPLRRRRGGGPGLQGDDPNL